MQLNLINVSLCVFFLSKQTTERRKTMRRTSSQADPSPLSDNELDLFHGCPFFEILSHSSLFEIVCKTNLILFGCEVILSLNHRPFLGCMWLVALPALEPAKSAPPL